MANPTNAYTYRGSEFTGRDLHFLCPTFRESYEAVIQKYGKRSFLKVYEKALPICKSFEEFDHDVLNAISFFSNHNLRKKSFVSIGRNTYRHLVYLTSAMLTGMTITPINPAEGVTRLAEKIAGISADAAIFCDDHELLASLKGLLPQAQLMELHTREVAPTKDRVKFSSDWPLICPFTSGSTGYSKQVEQMEWNVLANVDALIGHHKLGPGVVLATSMPIFHVSALEFSFFGALLSGASFVLYSAFDLSIVSHSLARDSVQILSVVPSILKAILDRRVDFSILRGEEFRYVVCGASALPKSLALEFMEVFQKPVVQSYGLSEAVQTCASMPIDLELTAYRKWYGSFAHPSIGLEIRGNEIEILNSEGRCLGPGIEGEIAVRGFNVMRSYRGMDATLLFPNGYFRTGDLGYFVLDEAGVRYFFISGRKKDVIKRFSETVSLGEVDELISAARTPGLDAIAVGFEHALSGEEVGLVVRSSHVDKIAEQMAGVLRKIPFFMRPKMIVLTENELRTENGKPQRWQFKKDFLAFRSHVFNDTEDPQVL